MAKFDLDGDFVRKLADLLNETGLAELEYGKDGETIRVSRQTAAVQSVAVGPVQAQAAVPSESTASSETPKHSGHVQTSPMVGTVYLKPNPTSAAYVNVGDTVKAGDAICQIEAMKVFTQITADKAGTISEILVEDGAPVEFEQPLIVIS